MIRTNTYNPKYCKQSIFGDWHDHQCDRKPGYGEDKLYCKQHGAAFDAKSLPTETVYRPVSWRADVEAFEIVGETTKTWKLSDGRTEHKLGTESRDKAVVWDGIIARLESKAEAAKLTLEAAIKKRDADLH